MQGEAVSARIRLLMVIFGVLVAAGGLVAETGVSAEAVIQSGEMESSDSTQSADPSDSADTNEAVVEDVVRGTTELASVDAWGAPAMFYAQQPSMSQDGRFVAFVSYGALVDGDANSAADIFVRDRLMGTTVNASLRTDGVQLNGQSIQPHINADGRYVVFTSEATNVFGNGYGFEAYRRDLLTNTTEKVSVTLKGSDPGTGAFATDISADGRYVLFGSSADYEYVSNDCNGRGDVFLRDMELGTTELVSLGDDEQQGNGWSHSAVMSDDGRFVAFVSYSTNLTGDGSEGVFVRDRVLGTTKRVGGISGMPPLLWARAPSISADGSIVAFGAVREDCWQVFVSNVATGEYECVSVAPDGSMGDSWSGDPDLSADGRRVAFVSMATNLVLGDVNKRSDVFFRDLATGVTKRVSVTNKREEAALGGGGDAWGAPSTDASGSAFAFTAIGTSYGDPCTHELVYVRDVEETASIEQSANHLDKTLTVSLSSYGATAAVRGQMCTGEGAFGGERLSVVNVRGGSPIFTTTSASGRFSVDLRPQSKTTYRIAPVDDQAWAASAQRLVTVIPRAYVSNPIAPAKMRRSRYYTIYGYLKPRHTSGSKPVRIKCYRKNSAGVYKYHHTVYAKASDYYSYSKYKARVKLPYRGRWRLRAYAPADSSHAASQSRGYDYVTVR